PNLKPLYAVLPAKGSDNNAWEPTAQYYDTVELRNSQVQSPDIYTETGYEHRLLLATNLYSGKQSKNLYPFWAVWPDPTVADELGLLTQNINDYINTNAAAFITGSKSLDKDWDAYVKGLNDLGLPHYLDLLQKQYDALKK
ncbi:MAG TPA: hypothetical protein VMT24_03290, partial [Aggregatilineaceae bacterium]|nr:hypothetical protein [Aggregatilineaceae bacterium]